MSERKSINKYRGDDFYQEDFDKLRKKLKKQQKGAARGPQVQDVRLMAPFSLKCLNCNEYIAKNRKFNAKKETTSQTYLGLKIFRFSIRCPRCANIITYRTDPKTADYITESGAVRNYISTQSNEAQKYKDESLEETLERLEKEQQEAKELEEKKKKGEKDLDDEATVMEKLEKKLEQNENEQRANEELENLLHRNANRSDEGSAQRVSNEKEDDELERLAKEAFKNHSRTATASYIPKNLITGNTTKVTKLTKRKKKIVI